MRSEQLGLWQSVDRLGFANAFIVAERVEVFSRKAGAPAEEGVRWESTGEGEFTVETVNRESRGTTVVLHLKEDAKDFADGFRLRSLVRRYPTNLQAVSSPG